MGEIEVATKLLVNDAEEDEVRTDPASHLSIFIHVLEDE